MLGHGIGSHNPSVWRLNYCMSIKIVSRTAKTKYRIPEHSR
jgi:hypothetical protein